MEKISDFCFRSEITAMCYSLYDNPAVKAEARKSFPKKIVISKTDYSRIINICVVF